MAVTVDGDLPAGVTAKDVILAIIGRIGTGGGIGHVIEYRGSAIRALSMEGRMTVCNMSIEAGARAGLIAPDDTTFAYLEGRPPRPDAAPTGSAAVDDWRTLRTDDGATFDTEVMIDAADAAAARLVGHQPRPGRRRSTASVPDPDSVRRRRRPRVRRPRARVHGPHRRHAAARHRRRHRLHRLVHQQPHRGPARRRRGGRRPPRHASARALVVPGSHAGEGPGRGRGPRPRLHAPPASTGASPAARCAWP